MHTSFEMLVPELLKHCAPSSSLSSCWARKVFTSSATLGAEC